MEVAPDAEQPDLFRRAFETFHLMRGNLRHVLFRRSYAQRIVGVLERGLPLVGDPEVAAGYLGSWSAQEIADLARMVDQIDRQFAGADFAEFDRPVRDALLEARSAAAGTTGRLELDTATLTRLTPSLRGRHQEYVRRIEGASLHARPSAPWTVARLQAVLPDDAAAVAYFWPRNGAPKAYVVTRERVRVTPLPPPDQPDGLAFDPIAAPSNDLRRRIHRHLVEPWLDDVLGSGVRSLYLVPYDRLFKLPIHCAQDGPAAPLLLHHPGLDRVLYSVSLEELGQSLGATESARFGPYGDTVLVGNGLAVLDPAGDLARAGGAVFDRLRSTIDELEGGRRLRSLAGDAATHRSVLEALRTAGWWLHLGHGNVPLSEEANEQRQMEAAALQEEARIGAMLELADGILEDLDILLRCPLEALRFCVLSACVSVGMDVSAGNEIAGFVRALKVRRCGPIVLAYWEIARDAGMAVLERMVRVLHARPRRYPPTQRSDVLGSAYAVDTGGPLDLSAALIQALGDAGAPGLHLGRDRPNSGMFGIYV